MGIGPDYKMNKKYPYSVDYPSLTAPFRRYLSIYCFLPPHLALCFRQSFCRLRALSRKRKVITSTFEARFSFLEAFGKCYRQPIQAHPSLQNTGVLQNFHYVRHKLVPVKTEHSTLVYFLHTEHFPPTIDQCGQLTRFI